MTLWKNVYTALKNRQVLSDSTDPAATQSRATFRHTLNFHVVGVLAHEGTAAATNLRTVLSRTVQLGPPSLQITLCQVCAIINAQLPQGTDALNDPDYVVALHSPEM